MNRAARQFPVDLVGAALRELLADRSGVRVVDVGGGSGTRAVPLALLGCQVTVLDTSIDALAILRRRAAEAGVADRIRGIQADAERMVDQVGPATSDLVLCHQVLEEVDDPALVLRGCTEVLAPGGRLSVLTAARYAAVAAQLRAGRLAEAASALTDPAGRTGPDDVLRRRYDVPQLRAALTDAGLSVESVAGIGVIAGPQDSAGGVRTAAQSIADDRWRTEAVLADDPILRELARELHAVALKASGGD